MFGEDVPHDISEMIRMKSTQYTFKNFNSINRRKSIMMKVPNDFREKNLDAMSISLDS